MNTPAVKVGGGVGESSAVSKDKVVMGTLGFEDEEGAVDPSSLSAVSAVSGSSGGVWPPTQYQFSQLFPEHPS